MVQKDWQRCKNNVSKHNPEYTALTKRIKEFSVSNQICQRSFLFMPAKNCISKHINHLTIAKQPFHCALKSGVPLTKRTLAFSQFIPTPLVLCDARFPSRIPSVPFIQVFDFPSVRLLLERTLYMLLFIEKTLSSDTAANTGHISKACWFLFQPVLPHPNSILQLQYPK